MQKNKDNLSLVFPLVGLLLFFIGVGLLFQSIFRGAPLMFAGFVLLSIGLKRRENRELRRERERTFH